MTFEQAREEHLKKLDEEYGVLRALVADPEFTNEGWDKYKAAIGAIDRRLAKIRCLNVAELETHE